MNDVVSFESTVISSHVTPSTLLMILNPSSSVELSFHVSLTSVKEGKTSALKSLGAFGGC